MYLIEPHTLKVYHIDNHATVAEVTLASYLQGREIVRAVAVRNPADKHDPQLAKELAVARLYEKIARKQRKVADALLAQQENDHVQREFSKAWKASSL